MLQGFDLSSICLDDNCNQIEIHARHLVPVAPVKPHHRPKKVRCSSCEWRGSASFERPGCPRCGSAVEAIREVKPWQVHDEISIVRAIANATSKAYPVTFSMIYREVIDDYGKVDERTVHRYLAKLVDRKCLIKYDVRLPFAVYVRPKTRLTYDEICEYEYDNIETPSQLKRRAARKAMSMSEASP